MRTNVYAGGRLIATYDNPTSNPGFASLHFQVTDPLGSRRVQTDSIGWPEEQFTNLPYGDGFSLSAAPNPPPGGADDSTPLHFTGKERDQESGNDYFGARYYASTMGRFLSPDWSAKEEPVPYAKLDNPQTLNLYQYMRNNPLGGVDVDGHQEGFVITPEGPVPLPFPASGPSLTREQYNEMGHQVADFLAPLPGILKNDFTHPIQSLTDTFNATFNTRHGAMNDAKRDAGVPTSQQPQKQETVPLTGSDGKQVVVDGKPQTTREYTHTTGSGETVVIQDHSQGHTFPDGGSVGPHLNVRPANDTRHGTVEGTQPHYPYDKH